MTAEYRFYTNYRSEGQMHSDVIKGLVQLENKFGNSCLRDGYLSDDSCNMLYVSRSVDDENWEICGKLEYTFYEQTEMNVTMHVVEIHWLCADRCGQVLFNRFKSLIHGYPRKIILTCSLNESEQQPTVMCRLNFWMRNNFRVVQTTYATNADETMNVKLGMQLVLK